MRAASIFAGAVLAMVASNASHGDAASTHCAAGERVVYNCGFGRKIASICLAASTVSYRYGPLGAPELQISSNGKDGRAFQNRVTGSGGSSETMVRFANNDYSYLVYVETRGALADPPNEISSAIAIFKGTEPVGSRSCRQVDKRYLNLQLPSFVPREKENGDFDGYR